MSDAVADTASPQQRAYAAAILAYRLAQQHAESLGEVYALAVHMAEVLKARMEQARRELPHIEECPRH